MAWFEHSMRWVLITAFGVPVEPEVNRNLAMVSGVTLACAAATLAASSAPIRSANNVVLPVAERIARHHQFDVVRHASGNRACAKAPPSLANTMPGVSRSIIMRSLPKSLDISE